jgi:hypothetical protein
MQMTISFKRGSMKQTTMNGFWYSIDFCSSKYMLRFICAEIINFDGHESDRRIFLISVEQLRMHANIFVSQTLFGHIIIYFITSRHVKMRFYEALWKTEIDYERNSKVSNFVLLWNLTHIIFKNTAFSLDDK